MKIPALFTLSRFITNLRLFSVKYKDFCGFVLEVNGAQWCLVNNILQNI